MSELSKMLWYRWPASRADHPRELVTLTLAAEGLYHRLLDACATYGSFCKSEVYSFGRFHEYRDKHDFTELWEEVEPLFAVDENGEFTSPLVEEQRAHMDKVSKNKSRTGPRKSKKRHEVIELANANQMQTKLKAKLKAKLDSEAEKEQELAKLASQPARVLLDQITQMQRAFPGTEFSSHPAQSSLVSRIIDEAGITTEVEAMAFCRFVAARFSQGDRAPGRSNGPKSTGLLVNWAQDWRAS